MDVSLSQPLDPAGVQRATVAALEQIYRERFDALYRTALAISGESGSARDAVQDGVAGCLARLGSYRGSGSLEAWVFGAVVNAARNAARRGRTRAGREAEPVAEAVAAQEGAEADVRMLRAQLLALPERQRHVVFLRYYADLGYDDIAAALGIAPGTVGATLHAAHAALRRALDAEGAT